MPLDLDNTRRPRALGRKWGPTARFLAGAGGGACLVAGARRGGWVGAGIGLAGAGLLARAATGRSAIRLLRSGGDPYAFEARDAITIGRPIAEVFALLSDYANYPDFMPNVRDMEILPGLRHRWNMIAPGGVPIPVRDAITQLVPGEFVAWESEPGSALPYAGAALFRPSGAGTRVEARMSYGPPLGALGNAGATVLRQDPASQLRSILERARDHLEAGRFRPVHREMTYAT